MNIRAESVAGMPPPPDVRELGRVLSTRAPGAAWVRTAVVLGGAAVASATVALVLPGGRGELGTDLMLVLGPFGAGAACLSARAMAFRGSRSSWTLLAVGSVLAAGGRAWSAAVEALGGIELFPNGEFYALVAFHFALAEAAILALRPARKPRLAFEIALDGSLLLLASSVVVLRVALDTPLGQGWLSAGQAAAIVLGQLAIAASLLFAALLVLWRDTELAGPVVDGLLVATIFFAFGHFFATLGLDPMSAPGPNSLDLVRLGGWLTLALTAGLAAVRPRPTAVPDRGAFVAQAFRLLVIPASALFLTGWSLDAAGRDDVTRTSMVVVAMMGVALAGRVAVALQAVEREAEERRRAERQADRARLRIVTARMNPHFLFNALHSLSALIRRDAMHAADALERLGRLLRYGIDSGEESVTLDDEWRFARDYIELESLRLGPRLHASVEIDPRALDLSVPPFFLQPLVENAIHHGVNPCPEGGSVCVKAWLEGERLRVEVRDSGPGTDAEAMVGSPGVGVRGVRAQLASHFERDWRMDVERVSGGGFRVLLDLPARED